MTDQEKKLLKSCLKGEARAWDAFVRRYSNLVYHTIKKALTLHHVDPHDVSVEDLYQDVFVSLILDDFAKLRRFRGDRGCSLASWVRLIAFRLTIDFLTRCEPLPPDSAIVFGTSQPDYPELLIAEEKTKRLSKALRSLHGQDQRLIELSYRMEVEPQKIAAILRVSPGAVYTRKSRILGKLRKALKDMDT